MRLMPIFHTAKTSSAVEVSNSKDGKISTVKEEFSEEVDEQSCVCSFARYDNGNACFLSIGVKKMHTIKN